MFGTRDALAIAQAIGAGLNKYPPVNIRKAGEGHYIIEFAVAGFDKDELKVTVQGSTLSIVGKKRPVELNDYAFKGISSKSFSEMFNLGGLNIQVSNVELLNGILSIFLEPIAKSDVQEYEINIPQPTAESHPQVLNESSNF